MAALFAIEIIRREESFDCVLTGKGHIDNKSSAWMVNCESGGCDTLLQINRVTHGFKLPSNVMSY